MAAVAPACSGVDVETETPETKQKPNQDEVPKSDYPKYAWMIKPCHFYKEEYKDCKSFKARFHQYFVHGKTLECGQWYEDYINCSDWEGKSDMDALKKVVDSEKGRVRDRLRAHYQNDVWETRTTPPSDWNKELPEAIKADYNSSFLKMKADELKSGETSLLEDEGNPPGFSILDSSCSIV